jgi:signal transduction histidine kinase/putative methionine-R-sulfoxide reductase with GAF domain
VKADPHASARLSQNLQRLFDSEDVGELAQEFVKTIAAGYQLDKIVLRLFNPRTRLFEARAFHGCTAEGVARISTVDVTAAQWEELTRRAAREATAYRVPAGDQAFPDRFDVEDGDASTTDGVEHKRQTGLDAKAADDRLVVPLLDTGDQAVGYLVAVPAAGADLPGTAQILELDTLARIAVGAFELVRTRSLLRRREIEYSAVAEQLENWENTRDNFVSNVSHELRTPLTSIKAYAETLERSIDSMDVDTAREFSKVIQAEGERLDQIFDDLIDVAHLDRRTPGAAGDRVDLRELLMDVVQTERGHFDEKKIRLGTIEPEGTMMVQGEERGLRQMLEALLSNALKFTPRGGNVTIRLEEEYGTARIVVEDTGIGIPEADLTRVFERFYQVDGSSTRAYGGQGLGLALCRQVVERHHGTASAENRAEGGTRVVVTLPVRGLTIRRQAGTDALDPAERIQWESFLRLGVSLVSEMLRTRVCSLMLVDDREHVLRIEAAVGLDEEVVQHGALIEGEGVAGRVWQAATSILVPDLDADDRFRGLADEITYSRRSLLSVPRLWERRVVGVLNVNTKLDGLAFTEDDQLLLEALADRIVRALDSFDRYRAGYRRLASVESGVRAMLEVRRDRHSAVREVLITAGLRTGRRLGLDPELLRALAYALRTYDLGLAQVSSQILRKTAPLTHDERRRIEDHVHLGAELVAELEPSPEVRRIVLHHHENVDGSGYPDGLRGEAIPVGARIVRLVDALGALLHERPFRSALDLEQALQLLAEGVGRRFCPRVTQRFLEAVAEDEETLRAELRGETRSEFELETDAPKASR